MKSELYETYRKVEETHWWFTIRRRIMRDLFRQYGISKDSRILDVGCNWGFFAGELQKEGFRNIHGTDISEEAIHYGADRGINNLTVSKAERLPYSNDFFDASMALDVIEHIEDDTAALREMYRVTKQGGYCFLMVPAYEFLWSMQDDVAKHFRRYTKGSLVAVAEASGFEVVRSTYFNTLLFVPIVVIRFMEKFTKTNRSSDFELNNAFTNTILTFIFGLERYWLRVFNFPFGVSLLMILKKK